MLYVKGTNIVIGFVLRLTDWQSARKFCDTIDHTGITWHIDGQRHVQYRFVFAIFFGGEADRHAVRDHAEKLGILDDERQDAFEILFLQRVDPIAQLFGRDLQLRADIAFHLLTTDLAIDPPGVCRCHRCCSDGNRDEETRHAPFQDAAGLSVILDLDFEDSDWFFHYTAVFCFSVFVCGFLWRTRVSHLRKMLRICMLLLV